MGIESVSAAQSSVVSMEQPSRRNTNAKETARAPLNGSDTPAAVYEKTEPSNQKSFVTYSRASVSSNAVPSKDDAKYAGLSRLLESLFGQQAAQGSKAEKQQAKTLAEQHDGHLKDYIAGLEVDGETRLEAQQAIGEDGYWGVKQTSQRIIQFAIAISGGDTSKLDTLKNAILKGFGDAEKSWGTSLPGICQQTKEAVMQGLDEWASSAGQQQAASL